MDSENIMLEIKHRRWMNGKEKREGLWNVHGGLYLALI
jgi:hypothetical protein